MTPTRRNRESGEPRIMAGLSAFAGAFGICMQFFGDMKDLSWFMALTGGLGLLNVRTGLDEREHQLLYQAYGMTFMGLFFALLIATALMGSLEYLNIAQGVIDFLNTRWVGLTMSLMSLLLGVTGLRVFREK